MSDSIEDLVKAYDENVHHYGHPRSIGLFPIPEYPELEPKRGMWSAALDAILTTLRYLAPATLLTLFWGQQSFLFKLVKHIDSAFRAIVFSSEEQKQSVLQWLAEAGPVRVEHLETVWRHGWIVCGVLDAALPGACAGHPPTRLSLKHAQAIADNYLGVEPVFSRQELESNDSLGKHQEWKLATYLDRIRQSLAKLTPPVSKPCSQRTSPETSQFTLDYVARGSGLTAAQVKHKASFKIYPTSQQSLDPGEITILIRGPKDTYGMTVLPPVLGKAQLIRQKLLCLQSKPNYTENVLPITQGATYLRAYGKNDMNKTYYIPKTKYDIEIEADPRPDHTKICYVVHIEGKYDISVTSRGQSIVGSPFTMTCSKNILSLLERESFCLEDGEEIDIVDIKTDRKVVLRIVDFVTEKMLLKENGSLEKISEDEAKLLMKADSKDEFDFVKQKTAAKYLTKDEASQNKNEKFSNVVNKIIAVNRICKIMNELLTESYCAKQRKERISLQNRSQQDIPDVVNSTLTETKAKPYNLSDVRNKYIIPENIVVSLRTEKSLEKDIIKDNVQEDTNWSPKENNEKVSGNSNSEENSIRTYEDQEEDIVMVITSSPSNPFLIDTYEQNYMMEKDLGSFVATEYEANNSQNEEIPDSPIKILIEENITPSPVHSNNPFIDLDIVHLERPKTPVYKIISGDIQNRDDSVYVDPRIEQLNEEMLANEFINPFFLHQHIQSSQQAESLPITDFIIGAPVSLPPIVRTLTPEPNMDYLIITKDDTTKVQNGDKEHQPSEDSSSVFSTPLHTNIRAVPGSKFETSSSTFHSLDSNFTESLEIISVCEDSTLSNPYQIELLQKTSTPKKEIWDSAYVSIDENNSSPDSNNNNNTPLCETLSKQKFSGDNTSGTKLMELSNMGPAERELWQTCNELSVGINISEDTKPMKWETRRAMFTPIIEETDRSISSSMKEVSKTSQTKLGETDPVTVAFAELNDIYDDYFTNSETESTTTINDKNLHTSIEVDYKIETNQFVDSASDNITDVKRHANYYEGKISEVQPNVTESVSASQTLREQNRTNDSGLHTDQLQFGDRSRNNIVLERKKYWDDRIRQIEAKSQETTTFQKKRRLSSKYLRHNDSLTKRRGKQIVKNFLSTGDIAPSKITDTEFQQSTNQESLIPGQLITTNEKPDVKLVDKWKKYWDDKLESEGNEIEITCFKIKPSKSNIHSSSTHINQTTETELLQEKSVENKAKPLSLPVKQELPEEVFKAFETSPKRFFGTSRKQILSKIDTFLGKPSTVDNPSSDVTGASHDSGLVSSRISLFHSISHTEELPIVHRKSKSLHNIFQRNDSEKHNSILLRKHKEETLNAVKNEILTETFTDSESNDSDEKTSLKIKRGRIAFNTFNKSFDESVYQKPQQALTSIPSEVLKENTYVKKTIKDYNRQGQRFQRYTNSTVLRRKSFSKSEMDIFNKATNKESDDGLEKYKSCDELPKTNVKNFISMYESVSKTSVASKPVKKISRMNSGSKIQWQASNLRSVAVNKPNSPTQSVTSEKEVSRTATPSTISSKIHVFNKSSESISSAGTDSKTNTDSIDIEILENLETTFLSLSDIELEIVENNLDKPSESPPQKESETVHRDYKSRFKMAKLYFQSLEELAETSKPRPLNECELLLQNKSLESTQSTESTESPENRPQQRVKKNIKSHSMPSSEISKIWDQLQDDTETEGGASKLMKISEKFNVDDLFTDVMEGKLSRQGSLRGIPHKKAVLEAFRSMENLADTKISPYEIAVSQLNDFAKENQIKNVQTYLSEYPYLPTTDPSKYHSRVDTKASGLISLKEIIDRKPRRNSVPDLRLNPTFTVKL